MKNLTLPLLLPTLITLSTPSSAQLHKDNDLRKDIGQVLAVGDFNGDGYKDQAIGAPNAVARAATDQLDNGLFERAGVVHVTYGSSQGLGTWLNQYWHQDSPGIPGANQGGDEFGFSLAAGDFNGDGYHDLAIGSPGEDIDSIQNAGAVVILYGSWLGLSSAGAHSYHQGKQGVLGTPEIGDRFGYSVAAGDFNADGRDELAIGVPFENLTMQNCDEFDDLDGSFLTTRKDAGAIHVLNGHMLGLWAYGSTAYTQSSCGLAGYSGPDNWFGWGLATGKLNLDAYTDLVVTSPGERMLAGFSVRAGMANLFKGSAGGLEPTLKILSQKDSLFSGWVNGDSYAGLWDIFGSSVACGDFNGDGVDDVVIGSPGETRGGEDAWTPWIHSVGAINIFLMNPSSTFSTQADFFLTQNSPLVPGGCEDYDYWGDSLCVGDLDGDGADDIMVGARMEDIGTTSDAGMATVLYGGSGLLSDIRVLHQDTPGVPGVCEPGDELSAALSAGDFNGDGRAELSVGVPGEVIGSAGYQSGFVQVFDVSSNREITWSQDLREE